MKTIKARLTFTEGLLGTASSDTEIYDTVTICNGKALRSWVRQRQGLEWLSIGEA
ncbi:MAG: hypothetical protein LIO53_02010 [Oscillospiraceae bacterium]|nr:hypothetical protein [Oscillospiraceae bacterium]